MKKIWILSGISLALLGACERREAAKPSASGEPEAEVKEKAHIEYYTCSMHPQIRRDEPGYCPICGMKLVPVYSSKGETHDHGVSGVESGKRGEVRLDEARRQWIGLRVEPVAKRKLKREIAASARIASDPDLLVAQSDYLAARRTGGGELGGLQSSLVLAAKNRLRLLGMDEGEIAELSRRGRPDLGLLMPTAGQPLWIYASVFETDLPWIQAGMGAELELPGGEKRSLRVDSISPLVDPATRTANLRLRLDQAPDSLRPGMFLPLRLRAESESGLVIPDEALIETGESALVFVEVEPGSYAPRPVRVGRRGSGEIEILEGLKEGEKIVTSGNFLIDSESRLRGVAR
ncbi:MAG TPA: efflux RND transporter periplasmic adaptor subunit [bacterium]|nr:efflux RND transporter periplasmic adaptor subunit [bacterium]